MKWFISALALGSALVCMPAARGQSQTAAPAAPVVEAVICTAVVDHTPNGVDSVFSADVGSLCCWMRVTGVDGETTLKHTWLHEGKTMAVVDLPVRTKSWRTHSGKKILPAWTGRWEVKITDASGTELKTLAFTIGATAAR